MCGIFLKVFLFLGGYVHIVASSCDLYIIGDPIILKDYTFKRVIVPIRDSHINLRTDKALKVYCETGLKIGSNEIGSLADLWCGDDGYKFYATPTAKTAKYFSDSLTCDRKSNIRLYESYRALDNCGPHTSLSIGINMANMTSEIMAGVCYDWGNLSVKFINYVAYKNRKNYFTYAIKDFEINSVTMDSKLWNYEKYFNILSENGFAEHYANMQKNNTLLNDFQFDYASLIQDRPMTNDLESYNNILNIIWWRSLRLGNWRAFLNLLEERSEWIKYKITTGISGMIYIPNAVNLCHTNETLTIVSEKNVKKTAPAYIWAHLKALTYNVSEDFVVIGYNSPFFSTEDSIVLCQDICGEIDWLKKFGKVRLMPTMGLVFCCRPADVEHKLDNFSWTAGEVTKETSIEEIEPTDEITKETTIENNEPTKEDTKEKSLEDDDWLFE